MKRLSLTLLVLTLLVAVMLSTEARAEPYEKVVGAGGALLMPAFASQDPTMPALGAWGVSAFAHYSRWGDVALGGSLSWATYAGVAQDRLHERRGEESMRGDLYFRGALYHPEIFVQYKLLSGWDIAPYIEVGVGALWATYRDAYLYDPQERRTLETAVDDFGEGALTVSAALMVDWRIANTVRVGAAIKYSRATAGMLEQSLSVPVTVAYYWW